MYHLVLDTTLIPSMKEPTVLTPVTVGGNLATDVITVRQLFILNLNRFVF